MPPPRLFCFGFGFTARALAGSLLAEGWRVAGTSRGDDGLAAIAAGGVEGFRFAPGHPLVVPAALAGTTHLLSSVPPGADGDEVLAAHAGDIAAIDGLQWIGFLSSTSVYGDRGGEEVTESAALRPVSGRARRRVAAEAEWGRLGERLAAPVQIFRAAGIYGPGRSIFDQLAAGRARRIDKPGHSFSRIHVDDLAAALRASMAAPRAGAVYNICDDQPAASADVVAHACALLGRPPPPLVPFAEAVREMSAMAREFWSDNRRISNRLMHGELGVALAFPSYREGLAAILAGDRR